MRPLRANDTPIKNATTTLRFSMFSATKLTSPVASSRPQRTCALLAAGLTAIASVTALAQESDSGEDAGRNRRHRDSCDRAEHDRYQANIYTDRGWFVV